MPERILIISVQFPPLGGSVVQRPFYNADILSQLGHDVFVLTQDPHRSWLTETSMVPLSLPESHIVRVPQYPDRTIGRCALAFSRIFPFVFYPDSHAAWIIPAVRECKEIIQNEHINTLLVNLGAPSAFAVAYVLKKKLPYLRLIVDIQDLWTENPIDFGTRKTWVVYKYFDNKLEKRFLSVTDAVVTIGDFQAKIIRTKYPHLSNSIFTIPHGFDEGKFSKSIPENRPANKIIFRYTGYVHPDMKIERFFEAISKLKSSDSFRLADLCIEFYGGNPTYVKTLATEKEITDIVHANSHVDHSRVLSLMLGADVLLLFWTSDPGCICGKLSEYLRANRLIIAFDQGNIDGREMINKSGRGVIVPSNDINHQMEVLSNVINRIRQQQSLLPSDLPDISEYSRLNQVQKIAEIISKGRVS